MPFEIHHSRLEDYLDAHNSCFWTLATLNLNKRATHGVLNAPMQMAPAGIFRHLAQVCDINTDTPLIGVKALPNWAAHLGLNALTLLTPWRSTQRSEPEGVACRQRNSRVTAGESFNDNCNIFLRQTTICFCAVVRVA